MKSGCTTSELFSDFIGRLRSEFVGISQINNKLYEGEVHVARVPVRQMRIHVNDLEGNEMNNSLRRRKLAVTFHSDVGSRTRASCIILGCQRNGSGCAPSTTSELFFYLGGRL
jgi:hypothetical protein